MTTNALGEQTWPNPIKKAGQLVLEYEDHYLFYLRKEVYHKAAYGNPRDEEKSAAEQSEWSRFAEHGNADPEGVGLNTQLYKVACRSRNPEMNDLIIYDNIRDCFYELTDHDKMLEWVKVVEEDNKVWAVSVFKQNSIQAMASLMSELAGNVLSENQELFARKMLPMIQRIDDKND